MARWRTDRVRLLVGRGRTFLDTAAERSGFVAVGMAVLRRDRAIGGTLLAAALAFRVFIWLLPCALLLSAVIGFFSDSGEASVSSIAGKAGLSPLTASLLDQVSAQARDGRYVTCALGLVLLAVAGAALARSLDTVRVQIWGPYQRRGVRPALLRAAGYSGVLLAVIVMNVAAGIFLAATGLPGVVASALAVLAFTFIGVLLLGAGLPHWRVALPGAVLFAVGIELMRLVSTYYLPGRFERATELYGALGVAAALLVWLTLMARVVVLGHVLNAVVGQRPLPQ